MKTVWTHGCYCILYSRSNNNKVNDADIEQVTNRTRARQSKSQTKPRHEKVGLKTNYSSLNSAAPGPLQQLCD